MQILLFSLDFSNGSFINKDFLDSDIEPIHINEIDIGSDTSGKGSEISRENTEESSEIATSSSFLLIDIIIIGIVIGLLRKRK